MNVRGKLLITNQKTWDKAAPLFEKASALPVWGPFGVGKELNLIPKIKGKTFLEIGFGSGRSIRYLTDRGARHVYGIDLSPVQHKTAAQYNWAAIKGGKASLILGPMEKKYKIPPIDIIFSVYGIGWTHSPQKTFKNIFSYLKPGGIFIWSWDHTFFTNVHYENSKHVVIYSYHHEKPLAINNWKKSGTAHITYRKISTWFQLLRGAGFDVIGYHELSPLNMNRGSRDPVKYYSIQKARKIPATFIFVCRKPEDHGSSERLTA